MPDEKTGTEDTQETEAKETEEEEKTSEKNDGGDGTTEDEGKEETEEEEEETESEEDFEPEVRKRDKKDFIIDRLQKKNQKLESKLKGEEGDEEEDEETPEEVSVVKKIVREELAPIVEKQREAEDKAEVDGYIADNPQFKPYRDKMLKYRSHPAYEQLPIQHIATIVAGKDLMKLGASEAAKADQEAKQGQMGGGSARGKTGEKKSVWDMSKEEFEKMNHEILTKPRE